MRLGRGKAGKGPVGGGRAGEAQRRKGNGDLELVVDEGEELLLDGGLRGERAAAVSRRRCR